MDFSFLILDTRTKGNRHRSWKPVLIIERDAKILFMLFPGVRLFFQEFLGDFRGLQQFLKRSNSWQMCDCFISNFSI